MTDDITRGLALLADEVPPAPVDTVVEKARTRIRNRRAGAATALAVVATATLAISLGRDDGVRVSDPPTDRAARLTQQMAEIKAEAIPAGWRRLDAGAPGPLVASLAGGKPLSFACRNAEEGGNPMPVKAVCQAIGQYERPGERLSIAVQVFRATSLVTKPDGGEAATLADGTKTVIFPTGHRVTVGYQDVLRSDDDTYPASGTQLLSAWRPSDTGILVNVAYTGDSTEPPLTDEQLLAFATAFTW
jgi:hypothetical protein